MNICVVNGSPKGMNSITLQTVLYIQKLNPVHSFVVLHAGQKIRSFEKDFTEAKKILESSDLILFSYPVYTFLVPCQLHRFIELMKENQVDVEGKYVTQLSTSLHFYDVTAHAFVKENCQDMKMKYIKGLSAGMEDLTQKKGQKEAVDFFSYALYSVQNDLYEPLPKPQVSRVHPRVSVPLRSVEPLPGRVVIVTDMRDDDVQLQKMIERFRTQCSYSTEVVNIRDIPFQGGCISCFHCAPKGECIYKDGFDSFLRNNIQKADGMVVAFTVKDHSMGCRFKVYDDRQFCNGHRTVTMGMPFAYLVCGNLSQENNLRMVLEARAEVGGNFLAGIACDELNPNGEVDQVAKKLSWAIQNHYNPPSNFYGVGGMKIFRDLIWQMQGLMRADHKFYRKHHQYDFPQKHRGKMILMYLVGFMMGNKKIMAKAGGKVSEGMLAPYKKVLDELDQKPDSTRPASRPSVT